MAVFIFPSHDTLLLSEVAHVVVLRGVCWWYIEDGLQLTAISDVCPQLGESPWDNAGLWYLIRQTIGG